MGWIAFHPSILPPLMKGGRQSSVGGGGAIPSLENANRMPLVLRSALLLGAKAALGEAKGASLGRKGEGGDSECFSSPGTLYAVPKVPLDLGQVRPLVRSNSRLFGAHTP
ncbi:hypothetical protein KM043_015510 [Ampulex compressa]|nr:hypothetical protein KM043_015510 [Ampulex compressa]